MAYSGLLLWAVTIIFVVAVLCLVSRSAKFYVKLTCYYVAIFSVTSAAIPFSLLHPGDPGNLFPVRCKQFIPSDAYCPSQQSEYCWEGQYASDGMKQVTMYGLHETPAVNEFVSDHHAPIYEESLPFEILHLFESVLDHPVTIVKTSRYASWMVHHIISRLFGLKWEVKNVSLLKSEEPYILVCNHQSALDISGMMYIWPLFHPCVPVLKRELLWTGPFGIFCWLAGCVFVERYNCGKARDTLNFKIKEIKERKIKLWIFPEGTRNDKGSLLPFKKGAFHAATQAKIPIVPVVFSQYSDFYSIGKKIFNQGTITVTVLPWVDTNDLTSDDVPALSERVRQSMIQCLAESQPSTDRKGASNGNVNEKSHDQ